ncbi:ECF transporter S component [Eubacterium barkeri]|uniref:Energy-coupling factor transport system substrate-specific component n=1 Tax=Eubacterium barkeri TaxID=1528 RepID=A0A1H3BW37_EUBBA|nr:ECF transporter S component [Eubacterium barkeri]SDX46137.1 energy-coupling factor transport system substrate-specific component [Eubacterium barkeri]
MNHLKLNPQTLCFGALMIGINILGGFLALMLKLPIYLDSMGTILSALILGPLGGGLVGILTALINGLTFDPVSLYFLPVQLFIGVATGLLFKNGRFEGIKSLLSIILIAVLVSMISSIIVALVFDGVTSSGSSLIVAVMRNVGINLFASVFSTQIITDILDKAIAFAIAFAAIRAIPQIFLERLTHSSFK